MIQDRYVRQTQSPQDWCFMGKDENIKNINFINIHLLLNYIINYFTILL